MKADASDSAACVLQFQPFFVSGKEDSEYDHHQCPGGAAYYAADSVSGPCGAA